MRKLVGSFFREMWESSNVWAFSLSRLFKDWHPSTESVVFFALWLISLCTLGFVIWHFLEYISFSRFRRKINKLIQSKEKDGDHQHSEPEGGRTIDGDK